MFASTAPLLLARPLACHLSIAAAVEAQLWDRCHVPCAVHFHLLFTLLPLHPAAPRAGQGPDIAPRAPLFFGVRHPSAKRAEAADRAKMIMLQV